MAPIRPAKPDEPQTIPEALKSIKDIPKSLANLPGQLEQVYEKGTAEQQIETTIVVGESLVGMLKGKPPKVKGVVAAGVGSKKADKLGKVVNVADEAALLTKYPALADDAFKQLRKDPDFLKKFEEVVNDADLNKHIFDGEPKFKDGRLNGVSGVHSNKNLKPLSQVDGVRGDVKIQDGTKTIPNSKGYYEAKVQIYGDKGINGGADYVGGWLKGKKTTFFPDSWTPEKIQAEIANGIKNKVPDLDFPVPTGNTAFKATMSDGTKLQMVYEGDVLKTAFPNIR